MYISKKKLIVIFFIIVIILYKSIVLDKLLLDTNYFVIRRPIDKYQDRSIIENDYSSQHYAKIYLDNFMNVLQDGKDFTEYIEEEYYNNNISPNKEKFIEDIKEKIIMSEPFGKYHDIGYVTEFINKDGYKTLAFDVLVALDGLGYPNGYYLLQELDDVDKNKLMDIHVIEYSPYNFKITFPVENELMEEL